MLTTNSLNFFYLSLNISKNLLTSTIFYQKHKYNFQITLVSLTRKDYLAFLKYIILLSSTGVIPITYYKKIYLNQKYNNYQNVFFFNSKSFRSKHFILQKLLLTTGLKKKNMTEVLSQNFMELSQVLYDVNQEKYFDFIAVNFLKQKSFFFNKINEKIFSKKNKNNYSIIYTYDYLLFWGYSFFYFK
jgi:hypothetical protein